MKSKFSDRERLLHILDAIDSVENFTQEVSYDEYMNDLKLRLALVKLLEIIGEASGAISKETMDEFPNVEWPIIKSFRNVLIHEYFGIDYNIVWATLENKIPDLKEKIKQILKNF